MILLKKAIYANAVSIGLRLTLVAESLGTVVGAVLCRVLLLPLVKRLFSRSNSDAWLGRRAILFVDTRWDCLIRSVLPPTGNTIYCQKFCLLQKYSPLAPFLKSGELEQLCSPNNDAGHQFWWCIWNHMSHSNSNLFDSTNFWVEEKF